MKKTERINIMMRYINNRAHFTVSELMQEFNISRSTAIRDIREIARNRGDGDATYRRSWKGWRLFCLT